MTYTTVHESDGTIIVSPTDEAAQSAAIVICHGLGDTAEGFADVAEVITICIVSLFFYVCFTFLFKTSQK